MTASASPGARLRRLWPAHAEPGSRRSVVALAGLSLGAFVFVTLETLPIGLLQPIGLDLEVDEAMVGWLVTWYAGIVIVSGLPLTYLLRHAPRRRVMVGLLLAGVVGAVGSALAPTYATLVVARLVTALVQAAFWSMVVPTASGLFPAWRQGRAIATVFAGSSLAAIIGLPAGTWLGQLAGWRAAFWSLAAVGLVAVVIVLVALPAHVPAPPSTRSSDGRSLGRFLRLVVALALLVTGSFLFFTYVAPYLTDAALFSRYPCPRQPRSSPRSVSRWCSGTRGGSDTGARPLRWVDDQRQRPLRGRDVAATNAEWLMTTPIAHRGLHDEEYPENSLPAFVAAANSGFALELDLHMSSDGRLVVFHDADLNRMTGQEGFVADVQAAALTQLRLGGTEYVIPLFEEVLELVEGKAPILAEIKSGSSMTRVGPVLRTLIAGYGGALAVQSFDPRALLWLKKHAPHVVRGQICGSFEGEQLFPAQEFLLRSMLLNVLSRPDFLAFDLRAMPSASVSAWRMILDAPLLLWTIRTPEELVEARKYGANVIFEAIRPMV